MKKSFCRIGSKAIVLLSLFYFNLSQARTGVGHGGGGEWHVIECKVSVKSNQKISINICLTGETNQNGLYEIIPCGDDRTNYVTIHRITKWPAKPSVVETVKLPGKIFRVFWDRGGFFLKMQDPQVGNFNLFYANNYANNYDPSRGSLLEINLSSMKHYLRGVSCNFGSN